MKREHQEDLLELGAVTLETKGGPIGFEDEEATLRVKTGLSDD